MVHLVVILVFRRKQLDNWSIQPFMTRPRSRTHVCLPGQHLYHHREPQRHTRLNTECRCPAQLAFMNVRKHRNDLLGDINAVGDTGRKTLRKLVSVSKNGQNFLATPNLCLCEPSAQHRWSSTHREVGPNVRDNGTGGQANEGRGDDRREQVDAACISLVCVPWVWYVATHESSICGAPWYSRASTSIRQRNRLCRPQQGSSSRIAR